MHLANHSISEGGNETVGKRSSGRFGTWLLFAMLAAVLGHRLFLALSTDFPINDGALFYEFVKGVAARFPGLPETVRYNHVDVPFAYPPLSFWIGALLTRLGADPIDVVHYVPIAMNAVYVLLFALLLIKSTRDPLFTAVALLFFATRLRSYEWLVMGGGLSRGLGAIFLILTLIAVRAPDSRSKATQVEPLTWRRFLLAGAFVGLAMLSHLEWGMLAVASFILSRALGARDLRDFILSCAIAGGMTALLVGPWLLFVQSRHGLEPFLAAAGSGGWKLQGSLIQAAGVLLSSLGNPFLLVGGFVLLRQRHHFWFGFILLCLFVTPRHGLTPLPLALSAVSAAGVLAGWGMVKRMIRPQGLAAAALALTVAAVIAVNELPAYRSASKLFRPLSAEQRRAMAWIRNTHPHSDFAVVTSAHWSYDASAEWLPTLTGARSVTTVQGREWIPAPPFSRWDAMNRNVLSSRTCPELLSKLKFYGHADFLWVEAMRKCFRPPLHEPVYTSPRLTIFRVSGDHSAASPSPDASPTSGAGSSSGASSATR